MTTGHIGGVAVLTPSNGDDPSRDHVAFVRERIAERLDTLPPLRWQLMPVGLEKYWVETEVDLDYHVVGVQVPWPGNETEFHASLDEIMSVWLERHRPMWRLYVLEGLSGGRRAYLLKISHGLADGGAMTAIFDLLSDEPTQTPVSEPAKPERFDQVLQAAMQNFMAKPAKMAKIFNQLMTWMRERVEEEKVHALPSAMARMMPGEMGAPIAAMVNLMRPAATPEVASMMPTIMPPPSPFNGTVTRRVSISVANLPLADLRKAGKVLGGSINDALLAACSSALRRYMETHGGVPDRPLMASTPISLRSGEEEERWANQMWMLFLNLPTHLDDPYERLTYAHRAASVAKANWDRLPGHLLRDVSSMVPGALIAPVSQMMAVTPAEMLPKLYNVSVSNVKGPQVRPTYGGEDMTDFFVYGFLPPTCGLLVGAISLVDRMYVTYTGCLDVVRDLDQLAGLTQQGLDELVALS
ncbi:MAG: WS/DGAT domain-containing protein [Microlunatus sp.]|nr:WS/DGAT domain-containing protein [Microlunatus sp.]